MSKPKELKPRDYWQTPPEFFAEYHRRFRFTVDTCANASNTKLPVYWTEEMDAFKQDWSNQTLWINPPFSNILPWHQRAVHEALHNNCTSVLLNRMDASARWCTQCAKYGEMEHPLKRVNYLPPPGIEVAASNKTKGADFSSIITIYRPHMVKQKFITEEVYHLVEDIYHPHIVKQKFTTEEISLEGVCRLVEAGQRIDHLLIT